MKKITAILLASGLMVSASANAAGVYAGLGVGGTDLNDRTSTVDARANMGKLGFVTGVYAGYSFQGEFPYYIATEVFADHMNAQIKVDDIDFDGDDADGTEGVRVNSNYRFGIRLLPTYQINQHSDVHLVLGLLKAKFKARLLDPQDGNQTKHFRRTGVQLGMGSRSQLCTNWSIRGDVLYNSYGSENAIGASHKLSSFDGVVSLVYNIA